MNKTNEYHCQNEIENGNTCVEQCDHCREYCKPLEQPPAPTPVNQGEKMPPCGCTDGEQCNGDCYQAYDMIELQRAYCAGYIIGSSAVGSAIDAMADGKLKEAWERYIASGFIQPPAAQHVPENDYDPQGMALFHQMQTEMAMNVPDTKEDPGNTITSIEENPKGFHRRYKISKLSGEPVDETAEYMVLRVDWGGDDKEHIKACRIAAIAYANAIKHHLPETAADILDRYSATDTPDDHIHIDLNHGASARVAPNPSPELINALNTMVEKAMEMPAAPTKEGAEIPEEIMEWMGIQAEDYAVFEENKPAGKFPTYKAGAIAMYRKMQEQRSTLNRMDGQEETNPTVLRWIAVYKLEREEKDALQSALSSMTAERDAALGIIRDITDARKEANTYRKALDQIMTGQDSDHEPAYKAELIQMAKEALTKYPTKP